MPTQSGPYHLEHVEPSPIVLAGTRARYAIPNDEPQTLPPFDLFVYPMAGRELDDEVAIAREQLRHFDDVSDQVDGTSLGPTVALRTVWAPHPIHVTPIRVRVHGQDLRSFMFITRVRERFLKVRVSYDAGSSDHVDDAMRFRVERLVDDIARTSSP